MDKIIIDKLEIFANHGVYPEENVLGQKFMISVVLYTSTRKAGVTDELSFLRQLWRSQSFYPEIYDRAYLEAAGMCWRTPLPRQFFWNILW